MYSGHIPVRDKRSSRSTMFYVMFPSKSNDPDNDNDPLPLIMWLTGGDLPHMGLQGPGCSSELAWIAENGPFTLLPNGTLAQNEYSWSRVAHMLYVDQPLGVGFSRTDQPHVTTQREIAEDMWHFLSGFLAEWPEHIDRPFIMMGESYSGHYIPHMAKYLIQHPIKGLRLHGIAIGNGWVDPHTQFPSFAEYAWANRMIDAATYQEAKRIFANECDAALRSGRWEGVDAACYQTALRLLGDTSPYDIRQKCSPPPYCHEMGGIERFFERDEVRSALCVDGVFDDRSEIDGGEDGVLVSIRGRAPWPFCDRWLQRSLLNDSISSSLAAASFVVSAGKSALFYYGDQDFMCNWKGGLDWVNLLTWERADDFRHRPLCDWKVHGRSAGGAYKSVGRLSYLRLYNASHMVPMSSPEVSLLMLMLSEYLRYELGKATEEEYRVARTTPCEPVYVQ
ncbi:unnamed protein product [Vitrella brassicaformis CCMP3155]|uniref:Carboxypeptidase n=1 Tax=Vitrella brassicaformis (strain CCMP3155) TaxID=1169540 RepID=A0A0G4GCW8_VITBC|nr:unnamed protein product [Vitrella brassicaformis CCMP3155]|eukprot:CEM26648.1 unnamed protein product [Vitrella brassicaformis CCMP3155]